MPLVPELVRIHRTTSATDWNLYAMVAIIQLARTQSKNSEAPDGLREDYFRSLQALARMGTKDVLSAGDPETKRAVLGVIAIAMGFAPTGSSSSGTPKMNSWKRSHDDGKR